jgi:membrane dipeptidase
MIPVFDGHNDVLLRLARKSEPDGGVSSFLDGDGAGHLDLPRAKAGSFAGGLFAIFVPSDEPDSARDELMRQAEYDVPLPPTAELCPAQRFALDLTSLLLKIARASDGAVRLCVSARDIREAVAADKLAAALHLEGAEPIDRDFRMLEVLHAAGLRSLGPVWSRPNIFGHGVPFRFPSSPDTGPGLTEEGRALVKACNELSIVIDLSHMNERGFWDVAGLSDAPLVATHSNAHALSPHTRNLTDRQLAAIRDTGGLVGINFAASFLRADGRMLADTSLDELVRHADHLIDRLGVDGVGLGSDFDGAIIPEAIGDAAGLPKLVAALRGAGYDDETLEKLCFGNWLRVLELSWGG